MSKAERAEVERRLYGKYWKMNPDHPDGLSGVEQLKKRLEEQDRREQEKVQRDLKEKARFKPETKPRAELEKAADDMFKQAMTRAKRFEAAMEAKREKALEVESRWKKKSSASLTERMMRFQRLSMPVNPVKHKPAGGSLSARSANSASAPSKRAWMAGTPRDADAKIWTAGRVLGQGLPAGAVH